MPREGYRYLFDLVCQGIQLKTFVQLQIDTFFSFDLAFTFANNPMIESANEWFKNEWPMS